jgi:hypothetical protein
MNYFNYFTEIEDEFVKRRGSHMMVSPLDWSLIEMWQQRGIPLNIVLRGINASFDAYDARAARGRKVNSLLYCQQEVEAQFLEFCAARVGASNDAPESNGKNNGDANGKSKKSNGHAATNGAFTPLLVIAYLQEHCTTLEGLSKQHQADAALYETFARVIVRLKQLIDEIYEEQVVFPEHLETDLMMIEEVILDGLQESAGAARLAELRREGKAQLRAYRESMERAIYEQTLNNFIARRLREQYRIPRLSLFYL